MIELVREEEVRGRVAAILGRLPRELEGMLPGARAGHVGATAVPGPLTNGDLDVCVIVEGAKFERAGRVLAARFEVHQPENWSPAAPPGDGIDAYRAAKERLIRAPD